MAKKQRQSDESGRQSRIPTFSSIEEEAEFWDTHSLGEFEDELEDVTDEVRFVVIRSGPRKSVTVRLDLHTYEALKQAAEEFHTRPSKLVHYWIQERLHARKRERRQDTTP